MDLKKKIVFPLVAGVLCLAVCELCARFFFGPLELFCSRTLALPSSVIEDRTLCFRPNPAHPEHDRLGFRNRSVPEKVQAVAMGDSQTYGTEVARENAWPQQLGQMSGWSVYNMACGSWGPAHSLLLLDEAMKLKPEVIIEAIYAGNDLYDSYYLVYRAGQRPDLKSSDPEVLRRIEALERSDPLEKKYGECYKNSLFVEAVPGAVGQFFEKHSKLYHLCRNIGSALRARLYLRDEDWGLVRSEFAKKSAYWDIYEEGARRMAFTPAYRLCGLDLGDVRIEEGLRISLEAIRLMKEKIRQAGAELFVLLIPTKELVFKEALDRCGTRVSGNYRRLIENEEFFWERAKAFLTAEGIPFADTLPALRECAGSGRFPYAVSWNGHPNAAGNRAIAGLAYEGIRKRKML